MLKKDKFKKKDFSSGICLFIIGLFLTFQCMKLSLWSEFGPQEGFFPLVIGIIIMGCSMIIIGKSYTRISISGKKNSAEEAGENEINFLRVLSYGILMLCYAILIEGLGFLITSVFFLTIILKYVEKQEWKITILVGLSSIIISYLLFVYFLGVPLPKGLINW